LAWKRTTYRHKKSAAGQAAVSWLQSDSSQVFDDMFRNALNGLEVIARNGKKVERKKQKKTSLCAHDSISLVKGF
jgi:hypothetical protein